MIRLTVILGCILALLIIAFACKNSAVKPPIGAAPVSPVPGMKDKINGITMVAPPRPFSADPMLPVQAVGGSWIATIPYAFTRIGIPDVRYNAFSGQWWGERAEGVRETIRLAHQAGIKVMLKPQVYVPYGWTGTLDYPSDEQWSQWEAAYEKYLLPFAAMADSMQVELFCIGTEFRTAISKRPQFWRNLIAKVRQQYKGKLVYSSNWDDWEQVPFWKDLDYIGLSGYFPLAEGDTPSVDSLKVAWKPICSRLRAFSTQMNKPVLFTEFGYLSVDGCGWRNWELEARVNALAINQQAQANCYEALFETFHSEPWWAGSFLWKWFPNGQGHEGYPERDYTPQGKLAEYTLKRWYRPNN
jgi:hypothetical protein